MQVPYSEKLYLSLFNLDAAFEGSLKLWGLKGGDGHLWIIFCRSLLLVWHSSLTQENIDDLEGMQKTFTKLVLKEKYLSYEDSLIKLNLDPLSQRRQALSLKFAKDGLKYEQLKDLLPVNMKEHNMKIRKSEKYKVNFANTERLKNGSVIMMQNYLNEDDKQNKTRNCG